MAKCRIVGKQHITSKTNVDYYKLTLLQELSQKQLLSGDVGLAASDYFVEPEVFLAVDSDHVKNMGMFDVTYDVIGGRTTIVGAVPVKEK